MYTTFTAKSGEYRLYQDGVYIRTLYEAPGNGFLRLLPMYQCERSEERDVLLDHARSLSQYLREQRARLGYRYSFTVRMFGRADLESSGSGKACGIKIEGYSCSISGGNGECWMARSITNPDGTPLREEKIDVRDRRRIATDEWGDIKISRRKLKFTLPDRLLECIAFLESIPPQSVKLYSDADQARPTLRDVLSEYSEGSGGDDWALEEVLEKPELYKPKLIAALNDKRHRKYLDATIGILMICFPDSETRQAVVDRIDQMPPKKRDRQLVVVAAFDAVHAGMSGAKD